LAIEPASIDVRGIPKPVWNACLRNRRQKKAGGKSQQEKVTGLEGFEGCDGLHRGRKAIKTTQNGKIP
jgi:hypothetical protein